jgi:diadenosine tetraphosphate (Ap4A) HIT family hydrolase
VIDPYCDFCYAIHHGADPGMTSEYLRYCGEQAASRLLGSWPEAFAVVALGPVSVGNVMVLPTTHVRALAQLDEMELRKLVPLVDILARRIEAQFGSVMMFEHGMSAEPSEQDSGCIDHAHLQLVPTEFNLVPHVEAELGIGQSIANLTSLSRFATAATYLYVTAPSRRDGVVVQDVQLPAQYMRKLYTRLGNRDSEWNWRKHPRCDWIAETRSRIRLD